MANEINSTCSRQKLLNSKKSKTNAKKNRERGRQENTQLRSADVVARSEITHCKIPTLHNTLTVTLLSQFPFVFTPLALATRPGHLSTTAGRQTVLDRARKQQCETHLIQFHFKTVKLSK